MAAILVTLKSWFWVNWKTTVMGAVAAFELYQKTGDWKAAAIAFVTGLVMSDAKAEHADAKPALEVVK